MQQIRVFHGELAEAQRPAAVIHVVSKVSVRRRRALAERLRTILAHASFPVALLFGRTTL